jgi:hypothetical protein
MSDYLPPDVLARENEPYGAPIAQALAGKAARLCA